MSGTKINWVTQPAQATSAAVSNDDAPLFLTVSSFPKGPEKFQVVDSTNFSTLYGDNFNFAKYGQPAIQAARIVSGGGKLLVQRICADDAALSNLQFMASVEKTTANKYSNGKQVYKVVATGVEITADEMDPDAAEGTYEPVTISVANITYKATTTTDVATLADMPTTATYEEDGTTYYNLFSIVNNGRGADSGKRVRISFNTTDSRTTQYAIYNIEDFEGSNCVERKKFTLNPNVVYNNKALGLDDSTMVQFNCSFNDDGYTQFIAKVAEASGYTEEYLSMQDLIFGKTYKNVDLEYINITEDSVDFDYEYGLELKSGSNGTDFTFGSDAYKAKTLAFFNGELTEDIYNTEVYKIDGCIDANYDIATKEAIVKLAEFRKDFFYYRDLGVNIKSYDDLVEYYSPLARSKFVGTYVLSYKVSDPATRRPIHVTSMYSMVDNINNHFVTGRHQPFAGFSITDYIEGTIDFLPKITPNVNQKDLMDELGINYASFIAQNELIVETMNTSTDVDGQLTYIPNVLAVQNVIKDIRTFCPRNRYSFNYTPDFTEYSEAIQTTVIEKHMSRFDTLSFVYTSDTGMVDAGEFEASIEFSFDKHIKNETFNIYAMD